MESRDTTAALARDAAASLNERGFAILDRIADPAIMDRLQAEVKPWADRAERLQLKFFGGGLRKVESVLTKSRAFVTLLSHPVLHALNERILGPESLLNGSSVFILEHGGREQTIHTDGAIYEPMLPRTPGGPHYLLVYMWAVTDFTQENGATRVIPGSHLWPAGRHPRPEDPVEYLEMKQGSVAVWLGSTYHAASSNHTPSARIGTQMGFNCGWLRPHEANLLLVPPLVARDMPLNVQEVLGYRAYRGMLGCIEQQSPGEWLGIQASLASKSNQVAATPDPFDVEACTRDYFTSRALPIPSDVQSELDQLAATNAARAAAASEDDREVLEVVARSQSRHLVGHVLAGEHVALADALRQLPVATADTANPPSHPSADARAKENR
ncbi:MAG: phytanoyl-CoA dioxygenase family protein [Deltaproteobacteria bacterium]|nr:phytanoyl-CoA dioxygenase family protein [Deltaproteobacteria bacterium]